MSILINQMLSELNKIDEEENKSKLNFEEDCKNFWNNLSKDEQLKVFCFVIKNLYESEIIENKSYRGILYDKFNFGLNSYGAALNSGFLELHNSVYTKDELKTFLKKFIIENNIEIEEKKLDKFLITF